MKKKKIKVCWISKHNSGFNAFKWVESEYGEFKELEFPNTRTQKIGIFEQKVRITIEEL